MSDIYCEKFMYITFLVCVSILFNTGEYHVYYQSADVIKIQITIHGTHIVLSSFQTLNAAQNKIEKLPPNIGHFIDGTVTLPRKGSKKELVIGPLSVLEEVHLQVRRISRPFNQCKRHRICGLRKVYRGGNVRKIRFLRMQ